MRLIGHLDNEASAKNFGDYLASVNIKYLLEPDPPGPCAIWVHDEEQLEAAARALDLFRAHPAAPQFTTAAGKSAEVARREKEELANFRKRTFTPNAIWKTGIAPFTMGLIIVSVLVSLPIVLRQPALAGKFEWWLGISNVPRRDVFQSLFLFEVRHGEVWRLVTPIFLHFSLTHIVFNMIMLRDFGSLIENRDGLFKMLLMTVALAIGSNLCQYVMAGPYFGGMSGVLYGFFGFLWIRGKYAAGSRWVLPPTSITIMLIWYLACWTGWVGSVANWAHTGGLLIGMAWGGASAFVSRKN